MGRVFLMLALLVGATSVQAAQTPLRAQEQALRKQIAAISPEDVEMDLDATRFERWMELAENLARQRRVDEAVAAAYEGAGEIPTRSADFRSVSRDAFARAAAFEERVRGPSEQSTRAYWSAAISVQRGRSPVDLLAEDEEPFFGGYLDGTITRLRRIGRADEAYALAAGALGIATSFRNRHPQGSRDEAYERDRRMFAERRGQLLALIRTAYEYGRNSDADWQRQLQAAEALLAAGDAAAARRGFEALLSAMPRPIVISVVRARATHGLARALAAQGGDRLSDAIRTDRALLRQLMFQSWREDDRVAAVGADLVAMLDASGQADRARQLRADLTAYRASGAMPVFLR
ncbi:hypothetical protein [Sphingomonas sp.]|uniref:hypothetical protein n=1 Tax=Sphingomonas sp. TaxID=28214 RepID=UPI001EBB9445|nr:hypothetical protein [Sphingomonas sp.]MBX3593103.1 hypothetical protein [Sphingomonas sp.]